jgi:GMP synthase-like glutamine amidotransferase
MRIGILDAGEPPAALIGKFGRYDAMFRSLLGDGFHFTTYEVQDGILPAAPEEQEAYIVTGSPAGVYDDLPWIAPLKDFLRSAKGKAKLVGICFGHQVMAEAFGGRVEKYRQGWCVGLHRYTICETEAWMDDVAAIAIPASHQDQIVVQPPATRVLARSPFTAFAFLAYDDQPAISLQCHPEFDPRYAKALIEARRDRLEHPDRALASLDGPDDRDRVAEWICRFLRDGAG